MPEKMEKELKAQAKKKGIKKGSKRYGAYVYGTMRKTGWKPEREKKEQTARPMISSLFARNLMEN